MRDLALEVCGQVDNRDGAEGTLLRADAATDAEGLGEEGQSGLGGHFDAWFPNSQRAAKAFDIDRY